MFEESRVVMAIALLFISFQGAMGVMGAALVYDKIRSKNPS